MHRILYVGQLWRGGTCAERMNTLADLGHTIVPFDITAYARRGNRVARSIVHRFNIGPAIAALNRDLVEFARNEAGTVSLIWIDKGKWIAPDTLRSLRALTGAKLLHYTPDPQFLYNRSRLFERSVPLYDALATTKRFEVELYRRRGARKLLETKQGFGPQFRPHIATESQRETFSSDVVFVGGCNPYYAKVLRAVSITGAVLKIWGPNWPRYARFHPWARKHVQGDGLWGDEYPVALSCAKIGLGLLSKIIPEASTTRSFEIPATGTLLLADRTEEHKSLFREGEEAEYFDSFDELRTKIHRLLSDDDRRMTIASAGLKRTRDSRYSSAELLADLLNQIGMET